MDPRLNYTPVYAAGAAGATGLRLSGRFVGGEPPSSEDEGGRFTGCPCVCKSGSPSVCPAGEGLRSAARLLGRQDPLGLAPRPHVTHPRPLCLLLLFLTFLSLKCSYSFLLEFIGATLVNKTVQVSGVQFCGTAPVH